MMKRYMADQIAELGKVMKDLPINLSKSISEEFTIDGNLGIS